MTSVIGALTDIWKSKVLSRIRGALFYFHKNSFVAVSQHAVTMYVCKCEHCEEMPICCTMLTRIVFYTSMHLTIYTPVPTYISIYIYMYREICNVKRRMRVL